MMRASFLALAVGLIGVTAQAASNAITVRPSDNGRSWQTVRAQDTAVTWVWPEGATSARLKVTSFVDRLRVTSYEIARVDGAETGSWALPGELTAPRAEKLLDLELSVFASETVVATTTARVAAFPATIDLQVPGSADWKAVLTDRIAPYDTAWAADAQTAELGLAAAGKDPAALPLAGTSGYVPLCLKRNLSAHKGEFTASLSFDGGDPLYTADLLELGWGNLLILR